MRRSGMLKILDDSIAGETESAEEMIEKGRAMQRLIAQDDFRVYQTALEEAYLALCHRFGMVQKDDLPTIQGALVQCEAIMKLPHKLVDAAKRAMEQGE